MLVAKDIARSLTRLGYRVLGRSRTGQDALRLARTCPPALVLMDVHLSGELDGVDTATIIRAELDVPIVFLTAHSDGDTVARATAATPSGYVVKPFREADLRCAIEIALCEERARTQKSQDLLERQKLERELQHAQKLEAVGRLAAGVAHEINTPVQFVSDSVRYLKEAMQDMIGLIAEYQDMNRLVLGAHPKLAEAFAALARAEEQADLPYLIENVPLALSRSLDGLNRVATIVRSMKEFTHPDRDEMTSIDLNRAISATLEIARNEYKYVADVETSFAALPAVTCHAGNINQVVLNLIVNAAHAIGDLVKDIEGGRGLIKIGTQQQEDAVVITVGDTGGGIPAEIHGRIFEPFFTTKEVGRGTGQGLAIARAIVVAHGGALTFETEVGTGTTFSIRLPIDRRGTGTTTVP